MKKAYTSILIIVTVLFVFGVTNYPVRAETSLPQSSWYAVIWNRSTDTLHWVNNATELASMPRPQLPGEAGGVPGIDLRFHISPDGRYMVQYALLENERQGIGFYDFESGQWLQTHETQPGEIIIRANRNPFSFNSEFIALGLSAVQGNWRVIAFETATGDMVAQFDNTRPGIPGDYLPANYAPSVAAVLFNEALNQWNVHVRFIQLGGNPEPTPQPALMWTVETDSITTSDFHPLLWDFDVLPAQGRVLYSLADTTQTSISNQVLGHESEVVYQQNGAFANQPRWVANGQFVAFRLNQGAQVPMWYLGGVGSNSFTPFAPDYDELVGTVDGFVLVDYHTGEVKFANTLAFEAFTPTVGNVIYTTNTPAFEIAYITPMGTPFILESLATPPDDPIVVDGADDVQVPELTCGTAPPPRLTVGSPARVTFTDGSALNIRTAAAGEFIMQIPEGTIVTIVGGPVCVDNFFWWNLQFESQGATVGGWAAEGDSDDYYLAPLTVAQVNPSSLPTTQPTAQPPLVVQPPVIQPTAMPPVIQAPPTATNPPRVQSPGDGNCSNAPVGATLTVGQNARTNLDGTLTMRTNITDEFPSNNIPTNQMVTVLGGPVCNGGFRMWYVSTTLNGSSVEGWVADGFGSNRYLFPIR